jgi:hypothetical protein
MTATVFTEAVHPMAPLIASFHQLSIDEVIIANSESILVGQVLGATGVTADFTTVGAVGASNVGTTTIGTISAAANAMNGVYQIVQLATSGTGAIEVSRPDGTLDGTGKVGTAYSGQVIFTLTAGGTPTIGDTFTVTVTRPFDEGGEQFEAWFPSETDGSQAAVAVAMYPASTTASTTQKIAAVRRDAVVRLADLTFGSSSFTASQSTTTLTVTAMAPGSGPIGLGVTVTSTGTSQTVTALGTGTGGIGTYTVSVSQTLSSQLMTAAPTTAQTAFAQQQLAKNNIICR